MNKIWIETKRLVIRPPSEEDFENIYKLYSDLEAMKYIGDGKSKTKQYVMEMLKTRIKNYKKHGFTIGTVFEKETNQFVGRAGLIYIEDDQSKRDIEIGYALLPEFWDKGYGTELASACLDWGFKNLKVTELFGVTNPEHIKSQNILKKIGMQFIYKGFYKKDKVYFYSITRDEYNNTK